MAAGAEPSDVIGQFDWLPYPLSPDEAVKEMASHHFWLKCIERRLDPLWAYRYLRWRLGHPKHSEWRLTASIPGPQLCTETVLDYVKTEWIDGEDDGISCD